MQTTAPVAANSMILDIWGYQLNLMTLLALGLIIMLFWTFAAIQRSQRLDFADMFTKDGRKVSSTKVMQFVAGCATTWFIVKQGLQGTLTVEMLGVYLAFMASIEGFSKFISAKYNYKEISVSEATEKVEEKKKLSGQQPEQLLDIDGDGPVEAEVTETFSANGETTVQKRIKKG